MTDNDHKLRKEKLHLEINIGLLVFATLLGLFINIDTRNLRIVMPPKQECKPCTYQAKSYLEASAPTKEQQTFQQNLRERESSDTKEQPMTIHGAWFAVFIAGIALNLISILFQFSFFLWNKAWLLQVSNYSTILCIICFITFIGKLGTVFVC